MISKDYETIADFVETRYIPKAFYILHFYDLLNTHLNYKRKELLSIEGFLTISKMRGKKFAFMNHGNFLFRPYS